MTSMFASASPKSFLLAALVGALLAGSGCARPEAATPAPREDPVTAVPEGPLLLAELTGLT